MTTLKISVFYEDEIENLTFFAQEKGWTNKITVIQQVEKTDEEGNDYLADETVEIDNPITLEVFLQTWAREYLMGGIAQPILGMVERVAQEQLQQKKELYLSKLNDNLNVEVI